jgi:hypothetical protein
MVVISLKRPVSLTAKSTLADIPILRWVLRSTGAIFFHRKKDVAMGADPSRNITAIAQCRQRLELGEALLIFPEGQSHSDPGLRPLRSGAARIALNYVDAGLDQGLYAGEMAGDLMIIPVGLHFPEKDRFRSDVWVRFGKPLDPGAWLKENPDADPIKLTAEIEMRIRELTLNFERRPDSVMLMWAAEILETGARPPLRVDRDRHKVSKRLKLVQILNEGLKQLKDEERESIAVLRRRVRAYRLQLRNLGIKPSEVYVKMPVWKVILFILRELTIIILGMPIAFWGVLNHLIPAVIIRYVAVTLSDEKDKWASNVVLPTAVLIPIFYAVQIAAAWVLLPSLWAVLYAPSLPVTGLFTILYRDRVGNVRDRVRTFFRFLKDPGLRERLGYEGRAIIEDLMKLGELLEKRKLAPDR